MNNILSDLIDVEKIRKSVPGEVFYKKTTESTNLDAKKCESAPDKSVFIADEQTLGRGRLGRDWSSPSGCGIWMSIYLKPEISVSDVSKLTLVAGLAVSNVIENSSLKWPNDIMLGTKKVSGILTEALFEANRLKGVIVGIGINVNTEKFPVELKDKATSCFIETGKIVVREELISKVLDEFFCLYDTFASNEFSVILDDYKNKCITIGKEVLVLRDNVSQNATAVGISDSGELIVEIDGVKEIINSNEVSVRGLLGYA